MSCRNQCYMKKNEKTTAIPALKSLSSCTRGVKHTVLIKLPCCEPLTKKILDLSFIFGQKIISSNFKYTKQSKIVSDYTLRPGWYKTAHAINI